MAKKFELAPKRSQHDDNLEITEILTSTAQRSEKIGLLNFYKELPINSTLALSPFDDGRFEVYPNKIHLMVLQEKQRTILRLRNGLLVLADCPTVCMDRGLAVLYNFNYIQLYSDLRSNFRVRFDRPINVLLQAEDRKMPGMLRDISIGGACLTTFVRGLVPEMQVEFALKTLDPETKAIINIQLTSKVIRVEKESPPFLCCLRFELEGDSEIQLMNFINQRQMEIIKALRG